MKLIQWCALVMTAVVMMPSASAKGTGMISAEDKKGVETTVAALEEAWNRHDMDAYAAQLTDDCEWVNVVGMNWQGKAAVMKAHRAFHATMFKETGLRTLDQHMSEIAPGVVMVTATHRMGDYKTPDGRVMTGVEDRMTLVLVKKDGHWLIRSGHNTTIDPVAAKFDPGK